MFLLTGGMFMEPKIKTEDSDIDHINNIVGDSSENDNKEKDLQEKSLSTKPKTEITSRNEPKLEKKVEKKPLPKKLAMHLAEKKTEKSTSSKKKFSNKRPLKSDSTSKKSKSTKLIWLWILLAVIVVVGIALLVVNLSKEKSVDKATSEIAATVNGEPIYSKDINDEYNRLSPLLQQTYTKEAILNQTIDEVLLIQEAKNNNIKVTDSQIQEELNTFKEQNGLSQQEFEDVLKNQNLTITEVSGLIERRLMIKELLNRTILSNVNVSVEAINDYYLQNKAQFTQPEEVTVQHILILVDDNVTDSQASKKINDINDELTDNNFCELAKKYSEDPGSKDTCGTYTFGKGEMVPEFEDASFRLDINETEIVKSTYGYHLIKKLAYFPETVLELSEVEESIKTVLHDERTQQNFDSLLAELRAKATIVNYMYKTSTTITTIAQTKTSLDDFAKCITDKGAKFYGAYWCPHCKNQKALFGESMQYVNYVECAIEGQPQVQTQDCTDAGISGYPTWIINGEAYPGEQTLSDIARLTGCTI